jgi:hypothetical protein
MTGSAETALPQSVSPSLSSPEPIGASGRAESLVDTFPSEIVKRKSSAWSGWTTCGSRTALQRDRIQAAPVLF